MILDFFLSYKGNCGDNWGNLSKDWLLDNIIVLVSVVMKLWLCLYVRERPCS